MSNITQLTAVPADLVGAQAMPLPVVRKPSPYKRSVSKTHASSSQDSSDSQQRLVISEVEATGVYVYTILDRATGEVMMQIPREEVVRIAARPDYTAGQVVDTKV
jgi:flagellar protein FlaG